MTSEHQDPRGSGEATSLFVGFLSRRAAGDAVDFEDLCTEHRALESELRELEGHWAGLDDVLKQLVLPGQVYSKAGAITISPPGGGDEESWTAFKQLELIVAKPSQVDLELNGESISPLAIAHHGRLLITPRGVSQLPDNF